MRSTLSGCGLAVAAPALESSLRALPAPAVQAPLAQSLQALAAGFATTTTKTGAAAAVAGGMLMTQKLVLGGAVVAALALSAGYVLGSRQAPETTRASSPRNTATIAQLRAENDALRRRLEAQDASAPSSGSGSGTGAAGANRADSDGAAAANTVDPAHDTVAKPDSAIDWTTFSQMFAENHEALDRMSRDEAKDPADSAKVMKVVTAWSAIIGQARQISDQPFYDDAILTGFIDAIFSRTLKLDSNQRGKLRERTSSALRAARERFDVDSGAPLQAFGARQAIVNSVMEAVGEDLTPEQAASLEQITRTAKHLLESNREVITIGLMPRTNTDGIVEEMVSIWKKAYSLTDAEAQIAAPLALDFLERAKAMLLERGLFRQGKTPANAAAEYELDEAMLTMQIEIEDGFLRALSPERIADIRGRMPRVFRIRYGDGINITRHRGPGF